MSTAMPSPQPTRTRHRAAALLLVIAFGAACDGSVRIVSPSPFTGERTLVVDGTPLVTRIDRSAGATSQPTIVLMSGLDVPLEVWSAVRTALAADAPVFSYDRGGIGRSGNVGPLRTSDDVARELNALLATADVRPPFVLVAHSIAGLHARVFAQRYPALVAGIVLVDATHETLLEMLAPEDVEAIASAQTFPGSQAEVRAQAQSVAQVRATPLPDVPLVVLTSMRPAAGQTPEARDFLADLQAEWLTQVTHGEQVRLPVGHMVPLEAPLAIVEGARRVLSLRNGAAIAGLRPAPHTP